MKCNFDCKYDIVTDPIADDDMTILFRQYQNNLISLDGPHPLILAASSFREEAIIQIKGDTKISAMIVFPR